MRIGQFVEGKHIGETNIVHQNIQLVIEIAKDPIDATFYPGGGSEIGHCRDDPHPKLASLLRSSLKL